MLKNFLLVTFGGAIGSALRYGCSFLEVRLFPNHTFPYSTFFVNIAGCFIMGFLAGLLAQHSAFNEKMRLLLMTGLCGGFTTFSAFGLENVKMLENGQYLLFALYIAGSVIGGILAVWGGLICIKSK
ncbi:MAG: fluoride efflux transporter CrcB [Bacteroidales bacterium]|jgi:CrcB protein|nr:fluoride efflux transporter CrcB [Bacteroidales bacterium]